LPAEIAPGERLEMARGFVDKHFVSRGLAAQIDIHRPHEGERNWHAHILLTTRRLEGERLSPRKARDLDPMIRRGKFGKPLKAANGRRRRKGSRLRPSARALLIAPTRLFTIFGFKLSSVPPKEKWRRTLRVPAHAP
jgi:MobA/MobL family